MRPRHRAALGAALTALCVPALAVAAPDVSPLGAYDTGLGSGSAETVALQGDRMYVTNSADVSLDIVDVSSPSAPALIRRVDLTPYGGPNSVAVHGNLVAVAVEATPKTDPGEVVLLRPDGTFVARLPAGALPDMLTFTPDGDRIVVADEGEPSGYGVPGAVDPEGSVTIIRTAPFRRGRPAVVPPGTVRTAGFTDFNAGGPRASEVPAGVRRNGPGASVAQDLEPEYVTVEGDTAYVTLQEANAVAAVDLRRARVQAIRPLGWKDHSLPGAGLDPSDRDGAIAIANQPVRGLYMPDAVASFRTGGRTYLITANEGDGRDWPGFGDEARVGALTLDPVAFPDATALRANAALGRLTVSRTDGLNAAGAHTALFAFGARSATVWDAAAGTVVWDSGDAFEQRVALGAPAFFNSDGLASSFDTRSDNKGPEPEGVAVGRVGGHRYAYVGLERAGGFMVVDITAPRSPRVLRWVNEGTPSSVSAPGPDRGPEVVRFVDDGDSPVRRPLVVVANEVSGTVRIFRAG
jgi:hypothetical protein